jgi:hypothetical protein
MAQLSFSEEKPQIQEQDISNAEKALGCLLTDDYRGFLLQHNGGRPSLEAFNIRWDGNALGEGWGASLVHFFLSIYDGKYSNLLKYNTVTFRGRIPADTVAIAYDQGGNLILLGVGDDNRGRILFWLKDHEVEEGEMPDYSNVGFVADSFGAFLGSLHELELKRLASRVQ